MFPCTGKTLQGLSPSDRVDSSSHRDPDWAEEVAACTLWPALSSFLQPDWLAPSSQGEVGLMRLTHQHQVQQSKDADTSHHHGDRSRILHQPIDSLQLRPHPSVRGESCFYGENTQHMMLDRYSISSTTVERSSADTRFRQPAAVSNPAEHIWRAAEKQKQRSKRTLLTSAENIKNLSVSLHVSLRVSAFTLQNELQRSV